jgi:hypothetical protein
MVGVATFNEDASAATTWTKGNDGATTAKAVGTEPFEELDA